MLAPGDRASGGKAARRQVPRSTQAEWEPWSERPDPIALLEEQAAPRVPELAPIRYGRMAASPFAFFRGAAYVMASDLAGTPRSGMRVQLCGDAHLANFGGFASPERDLVFDLNDFDETLPGPWEWDVKRLAASIEVACRDRGFRRKLRADAVYGAIAAYQQAMRQFARMPTLQIWYARVDQTNLREELNSQSGGGMVKRFDKALMKARRKDSTRAFAKLATHVNGSARILADPPLIVPISDLLPDTEVHELSGWMHELLGEYRASLTDQIRRLVDRYSYADLARKVVGVGSVGTRAWVVLMLGRDASDPLFIQAKEAQPSVLEPFAGRSEFQNMGRRVVEGQRLMQAASDIFLGWLRTTGLDGHERDFYVRQLWDWKSSADLDTMPPEGMVAYGKVCGWTLARAHARSGDPIAIAAYLGRSETFGRAIVDFSVTYADQNERDHRALIDAIQSGRVVAQTGV